MKKQENGEKDENFIEIKEKEEDFIVKEDTDTPFSENGSTAQLGASTDRDARLIGNKINFRFLFHSHF